MCPSQCPASRRSSVCEEQACEVECRRLAVGRRRRPTRSYDRARASCVAALVAIQPRTACNAHSVAAPLVVACASLALALAVQAARNSETGLRPERALETISESDSDLGGAKFSEKSTFYGAGEETDAPYFWRGLSAGEYRAMGGGRLGAEERAMTLRSDSKTTFFVKTHDPPLKKRRSVR